MEFLLFIPAAYLLIGLFYGWYHLKSVMITIHETYWEDFRLREMVSMHNFTPIGADYYAQLQDLHITKGWILEEWNLFKKDKTKYKIQTYLLGCFNWVYYVRKIKKK